MASIAPSAAQLTLQQWREGQLRLAAVDADERPACELVTDLIVAELRRRLGGPYTAQELIALYSAGTSWCSDIAYAAAAAAPSAWDPRITADAAFARYLRGATDYAGGRLLGPSDD